MAKLELCGAAKSLASLFRKKELVYKLFATVYKSSPLPPLEQQRCPQIFAGVLLLEQSYPENIPVSKFAGNEIVG